MWFAWGQPERNSVRFYEINFGRSAHRWDDRRFDFRTSRFPNKQLIAQYLTDFGEDGDIGRVRVLGLPPMADELPFVAGVCTFPGGCAALVGHALACQASTARRWSFYILDQLCFDSMDRVR
jgi:hypothetical protein